MTQSRSQKITVRKTEPNLIWITHYRGKRKSCIFVSKRNAITLAYKLMQIAYSPTIETEEEDLLPTTEEFLND